MIVSVATSRTTLIQLRFAVQRRARRAERHVSLRPRATLSNNAAIGKPILRRIPSANVEDYVARLFAGYLEKREGEETFTKFCVRTPDADLISIAQGGGSAQAAA